MIIDAKNTTRPVKKGVRLPDLRNHCERLLLKPETLQEAKLLSMLYVQLRIVEGGPKALSDMLKKLR